MAQNSTERPLSSEVVKGHLRPSIPAFEIGASTVIDYLRSGVGVPAAEQDVRVIEENTRPLDDWALMLTAFDDVAEEERVVAIEKFVKLLSTLRKVEKSHPQIFRSAMRRNSDSGLFEFYLKISLETGKLPTGFDDPRIELDFLGMLVAKPETYHERLEAESLRTRPENVVIRMEDESQRRPTFTQSLTVRAVSVRYQRKDGKPRVQNLAGITLGTSSQDDQMWGFGTFYVGGKPFDSRVGWRSNLEQERFSGMFAHLGRLAVNDNLRNLPKS